jgi:phosphoribosylformimino-5-aminoimidazole carboxamide ribotide isomerase
MEILPAVDIKDGKVIRLKHGDPAKKTLYPQDPFALAERYFLEGASMLHVVDLDRAFGEPSHNEALILSLIERFPGRLQIGGGVREAGILERFLKAGASRVVVGTLAFRSPDEVLDLAVANQGRVCIALDCKGGRLQANGWVQDAPCGLQEALGRFQSTKALGPYIVTQVERDGTLEGPDIELVRQAVLLGAHRVILSGGIGTLEHIAAVKRAGLSQIEGVIVGKALLEGRFALSQAILEAS